MSPQNKISIRLSSYFILPRRETDLFITTTSRRQAVLLRISISSTRDALPWRTVSTYLALSLHLYLNLFVLCCVLFRVITIAHFVFAFSALYLVCVPCEDPCLLRVIYRHCILVIVDHLRQLCTYFVCVSLCPCGKLWTSLIILFNSRVVSVWRQKRWLISIRQEL